MKDNGGSAYPVPIVMDPDHPARGYEWNYSGGMSLQDWFAGQALQGILAAHANPNRATAPQEEEASYFSKISYVFADAMLAERSKP